MTRAKFLYELISQCMMVFCQDNILVENFELSDDNEFYDSAERQFISCMKFYDEMEELLIKKEIDEDMMNQELNTVLTLMRQKALERMVDDFLIFLKYSHISKDDIDKQVSVLKHELQTKNITASYLLNKVTELRMLEQDIH